MPRHAVTAAAIIPLAQEYVGNTLGDGSPKSQVCKLGRALVRMREKYFGNLQIKQMPNGVRMLWAVVCHVPVPVNPEISPL